MDSFKQASGLAGQNKAEILEISCEELRTMLQKNEKPIDLCGIVDKYSKNLSNLSESGMRLFLVSGKSTKRNLARAANAGTTKVSINGIPFNLGQELTSTDVNAQRWTAALAIKNMVEEKGIIPSMSAAIPMPEDAEFKRLFVPLMAPGYGLMYKALFLDATAESELMLKAREMVNTKGNLGRYFAGGVMLDWASSCRNGSNLTLKEFASEKIFTTMRGTICQMIINSQVKVADLSAVDLEIYFKLLDRDVKLKVIKKNQ